MTVIAFNPRSVHTNALPAKRAEIAPKTSLLLLWRKRHAHRAMLRNELLRQPDSVLADAGLTRAEAESTAQKPFWRG